MPVDQNQYQDILHELVEKQAQLVAVSKTKSNEDIMALYDLGQRDFGENYVQELVAKQAVLPTDIRWHFIGHLQSNKVKYIAPFVHLIHGVDSLKLLETINKEAVKNNRIISCLLQVHIATEESKFGFDHKEALDAATQVFIDNKYPNIRLVGLMGMASFTADQNQVIAEFKSLKTLYDLIRNQFPEFQDSFHTLSMGMSGDYKLAIAEGSNLVRIGSLLFGSRS